MGIQGNFYFWLLYLVFLYQVYTQSRSQTSAGWPCFRIMYGIRPILNIIPCIKLEANQVLILTVDGNEASDLISGT